MTIVSSIEQLDQNGVYSYADYLSWRIEERIELIRGKIFRMSPAPSTEHQRVSMRLSVVMAQFFGRGPCEVFVAPFDVRLLDKTKSNQDRDVLTVVQPDICVICDPAKIDERGCLGAPDWIVEILSPGNAKKDLVFKKKLYEENGVPEYWAVFPSEQIVAVSQRTDTGRYGEPQYFGVGDCPAPAAFPDLSIDLNAIFPA